MIPDPLEGRTIAGYRIEALIGRGGMSRVYRAEQTALGRKVAIKVLSVDLAGDPEYRQRFLRECRLAASIEHPNILPIYDAGETDGLLFIVMRLVEGTDLRAVLERHGPLRTDQALAVVKQTGSALDAAHAIGLIHRDVKPANILLDGAHVYLTDFGVAKLGEGPSQFTRIGLFVGTIDYASPEQIRNAPIDGRTDIYSLGCVFYECLTGRTPFDRPTEHGVMQAQLTDAPPTVRSMRPDLPVAVDAVIATAMAKDRESRYRSGLVFAEAARLALEGGATLGARATRIEPVAYAAAFGTSGAAAAAPSQPGATPGGAVRPLSGRRSRIVVALAALAAVVVGVVAYGAIGQGGGALAPSPGATAQAARSNQGSTTAPTTQPPTTAPASVRPPFTGRAVGLTAPQVIMPPGEFPFRGYILGRDNGFDFLGTSEWYRQFKSDNLDYYYIEVGVTVYSATTSGAAQLAKATCDITFPNPPPPAISEVTAEVIADGAKACQYHFEGNTSDWVQYQTATRNVLVSVAGEPRPRSISNTAAMSQMIAIARQQIAIIDRVAPR